MCRKNRKKEIEQVEKPASGQVGSLTFQELEALNNDLYRVCGEMNENNDFIKDPVLKSVMWREITKAYIAKSNEIKESKVIPEAIRRWTLKEKTKLSMPDYKLLRWFPWRKYGLNEVAEQCVEQAQIEAAMEYAARAAEIERQKEFLDGDEPSAEENFFYLIADEFIPARKRNRFINKQYVRLMRFITEYAQENASDKLYKLLLCELAAEKKREKFEEQNGEYLRVLVNDFIKEYNTVCEEPDEAAEEEEPECGQTADGTEEPTEAIATEEAETEYDDLSALYELADEPDAEEPAAPEEVQEQPEQVAAAPTAPEEATPGEPEQGQIELAITSEPVEPVQELIPLSADEPVDSRNGDGGNGNE